MKSTDVYYIVKQPPKITLVGLAGGSFTIQPASDAQVGNYTLDYVLNNGPTQQLGFSVT